MTYILVTRIHRQSLVLLGCFIVYFSWAKDCLIVLTFRLCVSLCNSSLAAVSCFQVLGVISSIRHGVFQKQIEHVQHGNLVSSRVACIEILPKINCFTFARFRPCQLFRLQEQGDYSSTLRQTIMEQTTPFFSHFYRLHSHGRISPPHQIA